MSFYVQSARDNLNKRNSIHPPLPSPSDRWLMNVQVRARELDERLHGFVVFLDEGRYKFMDLCFFWTRGDTNSRICVFSGRGDKHHTNICVCVCVCVCVCRCVCVCVCVRVQRCVCVCVCVACWCAAMVCIGARLFVQWCVFAVCMQMRV